MEEETENSTSRSRFLKRLGMILAAAIGAGALAAPAYAGGNCCKDCTRCGPCGSGPCRCFCDCTGVGESYCWTAPQGCLASGCVMCPC